MPTQDGMNSKTTVPGQLLHKQLIKLCMSKLSPCWFFGQKIAAHASAAPTWISSSTVSPKSRKTAPKEE